MEHSMSKPAATIESLPLALEIVHDTLTDNVERINILTRLPANP